MLLPKARTCTLVASSCFFVLFFFFFFPLPIYLTENIKTDTKEETQRNLLYGTRCISLHVRSTSVYCRYQLCNFFFFFCTNL